MSSNLALRDLEYCTFCPKMCRHTCPVVEASGHEGHTPQAKMQRLRNLLRGELPWSADQAEPLWACTGCNACTTACVHGIEPGPTLRAGRARAQREGAAPAELVGFPQRFAAREQAMQAALTRVPAGWRAERPLALVLPGCETSLDEVRELFALLGRLGLDHLKLVPGGPLCGGMPLLAHGYEDAFRRHLARIAAAASGATTLVMTCATCHAGLRALAPSLGVTLPGTVHLTAILAPALAARPLRPQGDLWLLDPCASRTDPELALGARALLARVGTVHELAPAGLQSDCCGGAGGTAEVLPGTAQRMAERRLAQLPAGGTLVTVGSECAAQLARHAAPGVRVRGLVRVILDALDALDAPGPA
jgi:Fe-S oxidoreductase